MERSVTDEVATPCEPTPVLPFGDDPKTLASLRAQVLPGICRSRPTHAPVRVWVVDCPTSDLPWILGALVMEHLDAQEASDTVRVFVTGADEARVDEGRRHLLTETSIARAGPPDRLDRYFTREGAGYRAKKVLRDRCLFGRHDLLGDPSFGSLDLIAWDDGAQQCGVEAVKQVLSTFHHALRAGGYLVLGSGAVAAALQGGLFSAVSEPHGILRRGDARTPHQARHPPAALAGAAGPAMSTSFERALQKSLVPPTLVVDERLEVVYLAGDVSPVLDVAAGTPPRTEVLDLVRPDLRSPARAALAAALRDRRETFFDTVTMGTSPPNPGLGDPGGAARVVRVTVRPLPPLDGQGPLFALCFQERDLPAAAPEARPGQDPAVEALVRELEMTRQHLEARIDDLDRTNEALRRARRDEILLSDGLEAANEELQVSREEHESISEELSTLDVELRRKIAELDRANADLRNSVTFSPAALVFLDRDARIRSHTPPAGALFHLIPADVGRPVADIAALARDGDLGALAREVLDTRSPRSHEVHRADGDRWFVRSVRPYEGTDGEIEGVVVAYVEVTEQKRAEEALRASEAQYRSLCELIPSIVWACDAEGRVGYANEGWSSFTGLSLEQSRGLSLAELVHPDDRAPLRAAWVRAAEARSLLEMEVRRQRADGQYRWFLLRAKPVVDRDGQVSGWFGVSTDVHDRRLCEEALREADRHKDEFLALLAHELRNPLAPIRNVTFLLQRPSEATLARVRGIIERQVGLMAQLVDDLLDVSRMAQGKMALERRPFDLREAVRTTVDDQRPAFEARHLALELELPREPLRLVGDAARITQVVGNLLHNALKFTPPGGRVRVQISAGAEPGVAALVVEDTGVGIDADRLPQVFDAFVQADRGYGGLGLGLSLVKGLAVLHGGSARAESRGPGCGARFTVSLPLDTDAPSSTERPVARCSEVRVMVVEDNEDAAESMRLLVELLGHRVSVERTGDAALARARTFRPTVVLCDIHLAGEMSGYDVARALRADPDLAAAHLVAVTGFGSESDRRRAAEAGFEVHLTKPVHPEKLERVVTRLAAG